MRLPRRIRLVVEMPGGRDGFTSIRQATEFVSSALRTESILRFEHGSVEWNYTDGWHSRVKDYRRVRQAERTSKA